MPAVLFHLDAAGSLEVLRHLGAGSGSNLRSVSLELSRWFSLSIDSNQESHGAGDSAKVFTGLRAF